MNVPEPALAPTKPAFRWDDPLLLDDQLTEEERMVRDTAHDYAQEELLPRVTEPFRNERPTRRSSAKWARWACSARRFPAEYGGAGLNYVCYGLIAREVERVDSGYRSMMSVQSSLVMHPIFTLRLGGAAQEVPAEARDRRVDRLLRADRARPRVGSGLDDDARARGRRRLPARRQQDVDLQLADRRRVRRLGEDRRRRDPRLRAREGHAGLSAPKIEGKFSLRTSITGEIVMDDVFVPEGEPAAERRGPQGPFGCLNSARYGIAWGALGAAEFCWHAARQYTLDRKQFGRPLAANQLIQKKLADMQTEITLGLQGCLRLGRLKDEGKAAPEITSIMKRNSCGKALEIARMARDMHGGNGIVDEFHVIRHLLNLETVNTYEGTHDIHALILGRAQTGIRRSDRRHAALATAACKGSPGLKLYDYFRSSAAYRVRIALDLKGLAPERAFVHLRTARSARTTTSRSIRRGWCRRSSPTKARC